MADPWSAAASVIGTAAAAGGAWRAQEASAKNVADTNAANYKMFTEAQGYDERMAKNQWSHSVTDMRNAGLNPAVMLQGAGGPTSHHGASPIPAQSNASSIMAGGLETARAAKDLAEQVSRIGLNKALGKKAIQEASTSAVHARTMQQQQNREDEMTKYTRKRAQWDYDYMPAGIDAVIDRASKFVPGVGLMLGGGKRGKPQAPDRRESRFPRVPVETNSAKSSVLGPDGRPAR